MAEPTTPTLDELAEELRRVYALERRAERAILKHQPGTAGGRRMYEVVRSCGKRISELRTAIEHHPDHSYDGL